MATQPAVEVQYLPPGPVDSTLAFQCSQFDKRFQRLHAISKESALTFSDFARLHIENHSVSRARTWIPAFANDPVKLRAVISARAWSWAHINGTRKMPPDISLETLRQACAVRFAKEAARTQGEPGTGQDMMHFRFIHCVRKAGGYINYLGAIAYKSFCLGYSSVQIAEELDMTPCQVRAQVCRLVIAAEKLGFETRKPSVSRGAKYGLRKGINGKSELTRRREDDAKRHRVMRTGTYQYKFRRRAAVVMKSREERAAAMRKLWADPEKRNARRNGTVSKKVLSGFDALEYLRRAQV